jgi:rhodanese-related sulfurtransferase
VALICARGNRSIRAQQALRDAGFKRVLNIREGMLGSSYGRGWLKRGLPLER